MRFTAAMYDEAIEALRAARVQLEPDGEYCHVCTDSGHQAMTCGHNPLVAMAICEGVADGARRLHDTMHLFAESGQVWTEQFKDDLHNWMHWASGECFGFGEQRGPAKVVMPKTEVAT